MEDTLFNQTFRDSEGKIVIAQMPNLPINRLADNNLTQPDCYNG